LSVTDFFSEHEIDVLARESGFIRRRRTMTAMEFLTLLMFSDFDNSENSLNLLAGNYRLDTHKTFSKQALDLKFNDSTVSFLKLLLERALNTVNKNTAALGLLEHFGSCRIKDSTSFQLPAAMATRYKGSGGAASQAMIRIQFEFDFKSGKIIELSLSAFNVQDHTNAASTKDNIAAGDLILRDLGYTNIEMLKHIESVEAQYIARIPSKTNMYETPDKDAKAVNMSKLYNDMVFNNLETKDIIGYISAKKMKVRIILERLPQAQYEQRLAAAHKEAKKKGYTMSDDFKARARLNIFITNIYDTETFKISASQIHQIYTLRWQVELIFKVWKSIAKIQKVKKMKIERFETQLLIRLIWIVLNWLIVSRLREKMYRDQHILPSFFKAYKRLKSRISDIKPVKSQPEALQNVLKNMLEVMQANDRLEFGKNKSSIYKILENLTDL
jgi:hypothetical protein